MPQENESHRPVGSSTDITAPLFQQTENNPIKVNMEKKTFLRFFCQTHPGTWNGVVLTKLTDRGNTSWKKVRKLETF